MVRTGIPVASVLLAALPTAFADDVGDAVSLQEVVVTAQKRTENLQSVPLSIEVLDTQKLEQLDIGSVDDYVKYSPSVSYVRAQGQGGNGQPGTSHVYMRGVVSGGDGNHSGSQPSVGTYFDEQPVTTIDGTVDMHIYDVERIEVLEGPQGTLYGASSEAGTIRIISNKPDPSKFAAGYDLDLNRVDHGGTGWQVQGFVNLPLSSVAAVRLVGWDEHDAGYIDNVAGTNASACIVNGIRTFPTWSGEPSSYPAVTPCPAPGVLGAGAISNAGYVRNNYNTTDTKGGRGALLLEIGDNWTVTPSFMGQSLNANGFFGYDPVVGDLKLAHFGPENAQDSWTQTALTIEGKFSNFDLVYAGGYMKRDTHTIADYSDYTEFYDRVFGSGAYWVDNNGNPIMGQQLVVQHGYFEKWSHELRLSTPKDLPVRATVGVFIQRQLHDIWQDYVMPGYNFANPLGGNPEGLATDLSVPGLPNTIWLTDQQRVDRDKAAFLQATWDITPHLSVNGGIRYFEYKNSLQGFYGYSLDYPFSSGVKACFGPPSTLGAPCTDLNNTVSDTGTVPRLNATYNFTPDVMTYATFSRGFRPGGVNRTSQAGIGPYQPDFLTNYEIGWKTEWFDHRLRWNGALFWENWKNFQFSFLGPSSLTIITNGGNARIRGIENELEWAVTHNLHLSTSFTFLDPVLTQDYCGQQGVTSCPTLQTSESFLPGGVFTGPLAPKGTNLPVTPKFKGNVVARYTFHTMAGWDPFAQASVVYQAQTAPLLRVDYTQVLGMQPAYALFDLAAGAEHNGLSVQLFVTNVADRRAELTRFAEISPQHDNQVYIIPSQPRTIALRFAQRF